MTHQRETFACLDEHGRAVRPAIVWMDVRATRQVEQLGSDDVHRLTGKPADTTPALYKLLWLCEHEPETIKRTRWVVDVARLPREPADRHVADDNGVRRSPRPDRYGSAGLVRRACWPASASRVNV